MNILFNIPAHKNCINCGECCGIIPATQEEIKQIREFLKSHEDIRKSIRKRSGKSPYCPFRNHDKKICEIYEVRPTICRLMGVCKGKFMQCPNGNSDQIDGRIFLKDHDINKDEILNVVRW